MPRETGKRHGQCTFAGRGKARFGYSRRSVLVHHTGQQGQWNALLGGFAGEAALAARHLREDDEIIELFSRSECAAVLHRHIEIESITANVPVYRLPLRDA